MEEQVKVLKKAEGRMSMPKKITIGDPMYFEDGVGLQYTYSKSFRGKSDWKCALEVSENLITCQPDEFFKEGLKYTDVSFKIYLAYDEKMLSLLRANKMYTRQKEKTTELGVDSASYIISVNNDEELIKTGGDGCIGGVSEYFTKNKLEGVIIEATLSDYTGYDYESAKKLFQMLFDCVLTDVKIE